MPMPHPHITYPHIPTPGRRNRSDIISISAIPRPGVAVMMETIGYFAKSTFLLSLKASKATRASADIAPRYQPSAQMP